MTLKELRLSKGLTQKEAANACEMSLRSYIRYENDSARANTTKYARCLAKLEDFCRIDEEHGILREKDIVAICRSVFEEYDVDYCYLFGSYAKGQATEKSDVDLAIGTKITGMKFFGLVELLRESLGKKVDLVRAGDLAQSPELLEEVLRYGVRIYG